MKFLVYKTSDWRLEDNPNAHLKEIKSLEELIDFSHENKNPIILHTNKKPPRIEIYDDWRE